MLLCCNAKILTVLAHLSSMAFIHIYLLFVTMSSSSESVESSGGSELDGMSSGSFTPFSPDSLMGSIIRDDLLTCGI